MQKLGKIEMTKLNFSGTSSRLIWKEKKNLQYATVKEQMSGNPNFRGCCAWKNILGDILSNRLCSSVHF